VSRVLLDTSALLHWPADRVIVATAEVLDVPVVTSDGAMRRYTDRAICA
jgi:PIN domain nuclease of toxin-antitoxin system